MNRLIALHVSWQLQFADSTHLTDGYHPLSFP